MLSDARGVSLTVSVTVILKGNEKRGFLFGTVGILFLN